MVAGKSYTDALDETKAHCHFTTHTPVEAGHDRFTPALMDYALQGYRALLSVPWPDVVGLGRVNPSDANESFCMTVLALKVSRAANGVSELHGDVSRHMWQILYPNTPVEKVPIGYITNGIHLLGWMKGTVRQFWRKKLTEGGNGPVKMWHEKFGHDWAAAVHSCEFWEKMADPSFVSDEELWALRYKLRRELIEFARRRLLQQNQRATQGDFIRFDHFLNPDALTIGFARRFATYKRAPLIFQQFENIVKLAHDKQRPIQFVFAGKAHPRDDEGKRFIQQIIHLSKHSELQGNLVFIENYDVHVARQMVSGCDIWLNNPRRPLEASGTSGQKVVLNGGLNLSVLDGWWAEAYDGLNGFAIGKGRTHSNMDVHDSRDGEDLYRVLNDELIPLYYQRDKDGLPRGWIKRMKRTIRTLGWRFSADRMVMDYTTKGYIPAAGGTSSEIRPPC
jgi:starch phosphorylase